MLVRVGKTGSLGPWSRVIVYCSNLSFCQNDPPMGESFWQKESLLQYTMTQLQGPKDHVLSTLVYIVFGALCCNYLSQWWVEFECQLTWLFTNIFRGVFFILFAEISQILLKISFIPILITFIYLVALNPC